MKEVFVMDLDAWTVDLPNLSATHDSGFTLQFEGNPKDPSAVFPGKFPASLSSIEQVRMLRLGVEAIAKAASTTSRSAPAKPAYKAPANKPSRPVISLKKKQSEPTDV